MSSVGIAELGLGTVELGLDYGVAGRPRPAPAEAVAVLRAAFDSGVSLFDTAPSYGDAERLVGEALAGEPGVRIVTKTTPGEPVRASLEGSLARLGRERVHGLLVHHVDDLLGRSGGAVADELGRLRAEGLVAKVGASVYTPEDLDAVLAVLDVDIVQLPLNVLDLRFARSGRLDALQARGVEVHARSLLLQGVLAGLQADMLPVHLRASAARYAAVAAGLGVEPAAAAIGFVLRQPVAAGLVGVASADELGAAIEAQRVAATLDVDALVAAGLESDDLDVIDPRSWHRLG